MGEDRGGGMLRPSREVSVDDRERAWQELNGRWLRITVWGGLVALVVSIVTWTVPPSVFTMDPLITAVARWVNWVPAVVSWVWIVRLARTTRAVVLADGRVECRRMWGPAQSITQAAVVKLSGGYGRLRSLRVRGADGSLRRVLMRDHDVVLLLRCRPQVNAGVNAEPTEPTVSTAARAKGVDWSRPLIAREGRGIVRVRVRARGMSSGARLYATHAQAIEWLLRQPTPVGKLKPTGRLWPRRAIVLLCGALASAMYGTQAVFALAAIFVWSTLMAGFGSGRSTHTDQSGMWHFGMLGAGALLTSVCLFVTALRSTSHVTTSLGAVEVRRGLRRRVWRVPWSDVRIDFRRMGFALAIRGSAHKRTAELRLPLPGRSRSLATIIQQARVGGAKIIVSEENATGFDSPVDYGFERPQVSAEGAACADALPASNSDVRSMPPSTLH